MKKILILGISFGVIGVVFLGLVKALHSPTFFVKHVEVLSSSQPAPLDDDVVARMSGIPVGPEKKLSLYQLDSVEIERRLLLNEWIKEARVTKKYPNTVSISVVYREPKAVFQSPKGGLSFVDSDGRVFGSVNLLTSPDLPVLSGIPLDAPNAKEELKAAILWMERLQHSPLNKTSQLASLLWEPENGYRAIMSYGQGLKTVRTVVELGNVNQDPFWEKKFKNLASVFEYLDRNSIATRRVSIEQDKKVVVKIKHGS